MKTAWQVEGRGVEMEGEGFGGRKKPGGKWASLVGLCSCLTSPFLGSPVEAFPYLVVSSGISSFTLFVLRSFPFAISPDGRPPAGEEAGQCGERKRREWPANDVTGILTLELGKSVEKTFGVHAPAARTMRMQGISFSIGESPLEVRMRMRMLERAPDESRDTERAQAGWCSCTPRARQVAMRN